MTTNKLFTLGLISYELPLLSRVQLSDDQYALVVAAANRALDKICDVGLDVMGFVDKIGEPINEKIKVRNIPEHSLDAFYQFHTIWAIEELSKNLPETVFVVVYLSPWSDFEKLSDCFPVAMALTPHQMVSYWVEYYRESMRLKHKLGKNLILINAEYIPESPLVVQQYLQSSYCTEGNFLAEQIATLSPRFQPREVKYPLQSIFQKLVPDAYDMYVSLESCAELLGRKPDLHQFDDLEWTPSVFDAFIRHSLSRADLNVAQMPSGVQQYPRSSNQAMSTFIPVQIPEIDAIQLPKIASFSAESLQHQEEIKQLEHEIEKLRSDLSTLSHSSSKLSKVNSENEKELQVQIARTRDLESLLELTTEFLHEGQQELETLTEEKSGMIALVKQMHNSLGRSSRLLIKDWHIKHPSDKKR